MKFFTNQGRKMFFPFLLLILTVGAIHAQTFNGAGFTVTNNAGRVATSCSTVAVSGITTNTTVTSVSLNTINHAAIGDLEVRLYLPGNTPPSTASPGTFIITSPPDARTCNFAGTYRFVDTAGTTIDAATTGCTNATNVPAGNYRTSTYGGGTTNGTATALTTSIGTLTPAQANGNWLVCVFDFAAGNTGTVGGTSIEFAVPTAASATIGGRVLNANGNGIVKSRVTLTNQNGDSRTATTNSFGYYNFEDVQSGETYTISIEDKRYTFQNPSVVVNVSENVQNLDFTANP